MKINVDDLKKVNDSIVEDGYRLVYVNNGNYIISSYSKTIEGFISELNDYNPYSLSDDIEFSSVEELLKDISNKYNEDEIYIYNIEGNVVAYYNKKEEHLTCK